MWQFMNSGKLDLGFFRSEWGRWRSMNAPMKYHFHLPWGPGLGSHHLPYEAMNWWKNFVNVYFK